MKSGMQGWRLRMAALCIPIGMFQSSAWAEGVDLSADSITRDKQQHIIADGHARLTREGEQLEADQIRYDTNGHTIDAQGHVNIQGKGSTIEAQSARLHTQSKTGSLKQADIQLHTGEHIQAEVLNRVSEQQFNGEGVRLSLCPKDDEAWYVTAKSMQLDQQRGVLEARHAVFYAAGVPLLYTPYWQQPLRRQSGLLIPEFTQSNIRGTEFALPYYWAPRPNWDVTLTPRWMSLRGIMGNAEVRHAGVSDSQSLAWSGIQDTHTGKYRQHIQSDIQQTLAKQWNFTSKLNIVSDPQFLADFATSAKDSALAYTSSTAALSWRNTHADATLSGQYQQNLRLANNDTSLQILPRLESHYTHDSEWAQLHLDQQTTRFSRIVGVQGTRVLLHPWLNVPRTWQQGAMRTQVQAGVRYLSYSQLRQATTAPRTMVDVSLTHRIQLESINDARTWRHALTPVIRYDLSYAPQQTGLVNFDSGFAQLTMNNLMQGNRFTGNDRFERMNRISFLLENSWQHKSTPKDHAQTIATAKIGIAYDMLRQNTDTQLQAPVRRPFSNILGGMTLTPWSGITASAEGQFDPVGHYWATAQAALNMQHASGHHLHIRWQRKDPRYSLASDTITADAAIRLASRWTSTARLQYDKLLRRTQDASIGIAYNHACWNFSIETYRNYHTGISNTANTGFRFLLGFRGLGSVGGS